MSWRRTLVCLLATGGVIVLAACDSAPGNTERSTRSKNAATSSTVAPTTTTTPPPAISYQIKRGDTLTSIAKLFGVSSATILAANQLPNGDRLTEGQVLQIPPHPPAQLTVTPPDVVSGTPLTLAVTSAKAGEIITFEIVAPDGSIFTGSPHTASQEGSVSTTYHTSGDDSGTYNVVATGDRGTSVQASYRLLG
jgi:LysM repeat protein